MMSDRFDYENIYLPQKRLQLFISKSDEFMLNLSNSQ